MFNIPQGNRSVGGRTDIDIDPTFQRLYESMMPRYHNT